MLDNFKLDIQWFEEFNEFKTLILCQRKSYIKKLPWLFLGTEIIVRLSIFLFFKCVYTIFKRKMCL